MTKIGDYNHETGGELIIRDMTAEELLEMEETAAIANQQQIQIEATEAAKTASVASAVAKLEAIGLTADEIAALRQ